MLVLARKRSEMIQIGDNIIIKVIETGSRWVKIGIEAPDDVRIIRAEVFGIPGPEHPLAAFLQKRREFKRHRTKHGKSRRLSDMLEESGACPGTAGDAAGDLVRVNRCDADDGRYVETE
jgi:carbon storage regulator CsrA